MFNPNPALLEMVPGASFHFASQASLRQFSDFEKNYAAIFIADLSNS
jgi:hypothetical protein